MPEQHPGISDPASEILRSKKLLLIGIITMSVEAGSGQARGTRTMGFRQSDMQEAFFVASEESFRRA
jgi:hypothetical protein